MLTSSVLSGHLGFRFSHDIPHLSPKPQGEEKTLKKDFVYLADHSRSKSRILLTLVLIVTIMRVWFDIASPYLLIKYPNFL